MRDVENEGEREADIERLKEKRLEEIVEEKVEQKTQKLREKVEKLETKNNTTNKSNTETSNKDISRRQFLKKAGLGTVGLAALMSPVSTLDIKSDEFSVSTGSDTDSLEDNLLVGANGNVEIPNGNLSIAEGQAIEDGGGTERINLHPDRTQFYNGDGDWALALENNQSRIMASEDRPVYIRDTSAGNDAVQYHAGSEATGTLELTNSNLDLEDNDIKKARSFSKSLDGIEVYKEEILGTFSENRDIIDEVFTVNASKWDAARISFYMPRADDANEMYVRLNGVTSAYRTTLLEGGNTITEEGGDHWFILRNMTDRPYMGSFVITLANEAIGRPQISREQLGARTRDSDDAHLINGSQGGGGSSALSGGDEDIRIWTDNNIVIKGYVEGLRWST